MKIMYKKNGRENEFQPFEILMCVVCYYRMIDCLVYARDYAITVSCTARKTSEQKKYI